MNSVYIMDKNSDYKDVFALELYQGADHDWQQTLLDGLPSDGVFTISLIFDQDLDSRQVLFENVAYQDLFSEQNSSIDTMPEPTIMTAPKGITEAQKRRFESVMLDWSL